MPRYKVNHKYGTTYLGPWTAGSEVELDEEVAEWVNRDSVGTLTLVVPAGEEPVEDPAEQPVEPVEDPVEQAPANRAHQPAHDRVVKKRGGKSA